MARADFPKIRGSRLLAGLYGTAISVRNSAFDRIPFLSKCASFPIVSIGNIHCGGTGKTPMTRLVVRALLERNVPVAVLSRGYGRKCRTPVLLPPGTPTSWEEVGDEPALLAARDPIWLGVDPNRVRMARLLKDKVPRNAVLVLDDGFQHRKLRRDFDVVCLPSTLEPRALLPHGPYREPIASLARAHAMCIIASADDQDEKIQRTQSYLTQHFPVMPCFVLKQSPREWVDALSGETFRAPPASSPIALTGIARPERFIRMARSLGVCPSEVVSFSDHFPFKPQHIERIPHVFDRGIITTEKDAQRLATLDLVRRPGIWYLRIEIQFCPNDTGEKFIELMGEKLHLEEGHS